MVLFAVIMNIPLLKLLDLANGQTSLSVKTGIPQATISAWVNRFSYRVGSESVLRVCEAVNWQVTPHQLRPDLYPHPDDGLPLEFRCNCKDAA